MNMLAQINSNVKTMSSREVSTLTNKQHSPRVFQQWFIDKGFGELKQTELGFSQPMFTTKGEAWVIEKLTSEGVVA